jgi:hypothetical protein
LNKKLSFFIFLICTLPSWAAEKYNKETKANYYLSKAFKQDLKQYCYFQTQITSIHRREIDSLEQGYKLIAKVADLPNKAVWSHEIDPRKSFLLHPGDRSLGMIYHFGYKNNLNPLLGFNQGFSDYYREINEKEHFKGCIVDTSATLKYANFEYKIVQIDSKVYLERTARIIPKINIPIALAKAKLDQSNKESLDKLINSVKS